MSPKVTVIGIVVIGLVLLGSLFSFGGMGLIGESTPGDQPSGGQSNIESITVYKTSRDSSGAALPDPAARPTPNETTQQSGVEVPQPVETDSIAVSSAQTDNGIVEAATLTAATVVESAGPASDQDQIARGREVFQSVAGLGCKGCHGDYGEGDLGVGPYIRGANDGMIRAAIDGINEMVVIKATIEEPDIKAVVAYVSSLGTMQVARTLSKRGRFSPETFQTRPGTPLQVVIKNSGTAPATYSSDNMGIDALTIPGRATDSLQWRAPATEGEYSLHCADCAGTGQHFVIQVDANAPEFMQVAPSGDSGSDAGTGQM